MLELGEHPRPMATACSDAVSHPVCLPAAARQAAPCTPLLCAPFPSLQGDINTLSLKLKALKRCHAPNPQEAQERCLHLACWEGGRLPVVPAPLWFSSPGGETGLMCWRVSPGKARIVQNTNLGYLQQHPGCPGGQKALQGRGTQAQTWLAPGPPLSRWLAAQGAASPASPSVALLSSWAPSLVEVPGEGKPGGLFQIL